MYVLLEGQVQVRRRERSGYENTVATLQAPSVFGEIAVIRDSERTADVLAVDDVITLVIEKEIFLKLLQQAGLKADYDKLMERIMLEHYVSSSPLFKEVPRETIQLFTSSGELLPEPAGKVIIEQGSMDRSFYLLVRGAVEVIRDGVAVGQIRQGGFFGEIALIANVPRTATVRTINETLLLKIDSTTFWRILSENIHMSLYIETVAEMRMNTADPASTLDAI